MTSYVVLFNDDGGDGYAVVSRVDATSSVAAVRDAAGTEQKSGTYVAIPARSFDPVKIEIETNPRVKVVK